MNRIKYLLALLSIMAGVSCLQEDEIYAPDIIFLEPVPGFVVDMPDTMAVSVEISDEVPIRSVILRIVDLNSVPVTSAGYYYPNTPQYSLSALIPVSDKALPGGSYYVMVTVSDGVNSKNKYQEIVIHEIAQEILGYFAVARLPNLRTSISRLNIDFEPDTQIVIYEKYAISEVHGLHEQFYFVPEQPSRIIAFNAWNMDVEWEMPALSPRPVITGILADQDLIFSTANGDAGILSQEGDIILRTPPDDSYSVNCLAVDENYIYTSLALPGSNYNRLRIFYKTSGNIRDEKSIAGEIKSIIPVAPDAVLVFLPSEEGTLILEYDPENFTVGQSDFFPNDYVHSVEKISGNELFLLTGSRVISYEIMEKRATEFAGRAFEVCSYEPLNDLIFLISDSLVFGYDRRTSNLMFTRTFAGEVSDFQVLYNK